MTTILPAGATTQLQCHYKLEKTKEGSAGPTGSICYFPVKVRVDAGGKYIFQGDNHLPGVVTETCGASW